jgi:hypothetical protein
MASEGPFQNSIASTNKRETFHGRRNSRPSRSSAYDHHRCCSLTQGNDVVSTIALILVHFACRVGGWCVV